MDYMNCPVCREKSVPVGGDECEFCDWKKGSGKKEELSSTTKDIVSTQGSSDNDSSRQDASKTGVYLKDVPKPTKENNYIRYCTIEEPCSVCGRNDGARQMVRNPPKCQACYNNPKRGNKTAQKAEEPVPEPFRGAPELVKKICDSPQSADKQPANEPEKLPASIREGKVVHLTDGAPVIQKPACQPAAERIVLEIHEYDLSLFAQLKQWADEERRSIPGQILHILDKVVPARADRVI